MRFVKTAAALAIAAASFSLAAAQTIQINRDNKTIAVTATDEASATADIAAIYVGFEVFGPDSDSTYAAGGKVSHAVLDALHKAGVKDENIESVDQGIQRNMQFSDKDNAEDRAKRQFVLRQSWTVSVDPKVAGDVIKLAIAAGADKTGSIDWKLKERKALQARAAQSALVKARGVASTMAEGMGVKLGALLYASNEVPNQGIMPRARVMAAPMMEMASKEQQEAPNLEIRAQTIREEATVYAVFAIE